MELVKTTRAIAPFKTRNLRGTTESTALDGWVRKSSGFSVSCFGLRNIKLAKGKIRESETG